MHYIAMIEYDRSIRYEQLADHDLLEVVGRFTDGKNNGGMISWMLICLML